ncbi:MAG: GMC family oxidoreductase [Gemmatimonadota bacterium]
MPQQASVHHPLSSTVDFVIVGSGAAGGILAKELSTAGYSVVVLERGPRLTPEQFEHDEFKYFFQNYIGAKTPVTWRETPSQVAKLKKDAVWGAHIVGGSSVHFTANFWRFRPVDFNERSRLGAIPGASLADWPITYDELEPYYTKVDWEIGVSGQAGGWGEPRRSRPYPVPPLPVKSSGVLFERATKKLGWHPFPAPMAILSRPLNGRMACQNCGFCQGYGCEFGAKSSTLAAMIPLAERTGKCEVRANSYVRKVEVNAAGRTTGVIYFDANGREQFQRAKAVVLSCNGAETSRLLLMSKSNAFPQGLANSSGIVGQHLMFNAGAIVPGFYEHPLNEYKGAQVTRIALDWYDSDPKRGFYGGGGLDARADITLPIFFALNGAPPGMRNWGAEHKRFLEHGFTRQMTVMAHTTSLPVAANSVSLDPTLKDDHGLPAMRITYRDHEDDLKMSRYLHARAVEVHHAAGAQQVAPLPVEVQGTAVHLLGTCRMGNDPKTSVVDRFHRTHDVRNLFICDGSSLVTSGRGQPTMTIMALAFRAGEKLAEFAKRGEI